MLKQYEKLDDFLLQHSPAGPFLFEDFGWAETVFTPFFMRFWFLEYYEDFQLPLDGRYARVQRWIDACLAHPAAQQVCKEEIVKLYYDYAMGAGNGAFLPGRQAVFVHVHARLAVTTLATTEQVRTRRERWRAGLVADIKTGRLR